MSTHTPGDCSCGYKSTPEIHRFDLKLKTVGFTVSCHGCGRTTGQHKLKRSAIKEWNETIAAPELLNRLENLALSLSIDRDDYPDLQLYNITMDAIKKAKAAIRKAKGA